MYICEPYALSSKNTNEYELKSRLCQLLYKRYDGRVWFVYVPLTSYVTNYYVAMKFAGHCCPPQLFFRLATTKSLPPYIFSSIVEL